MHVLLPSLLACPRCKAELLIREPHCLCKKCEISYTIEHGIPLLSDSAINRDKRLAVEEHAQNQARHMYIDANSIVNKREEYLYQDLMNGLSELSGPVADIGCGVGRLGHVLNKTRRGNIDLIGMDLTTSLLSHAGEGYASLVEGDIHRLPFKSNVFSAVILHNILHHAVDPQKAFQESVRVLKPGGIVQMYDPRYFSFIENIKRILPRDQSAFAPTHTAFSLKQYRTLLHDPSIRLETLTIKAIDPIGPVVSTLLDLAHTGALGIADSIGWLLNKIDRTIDFLDPTHTLGLMVLARARKLP